MYKVSRPYLKAGLIISIVIFSILALGFFAIMTNPQMYGLPEEIGGVIILLSLFAIVGIIFASIGLSICSKPIGVYRQKSGFVVTTFILMCIASFFELIGTLESGLTAGTIAFFAMAVGTVFIIVGHVKARKEAAPIADYDMNNPDQNLDTIRQLRDNNVISEEEYLKLVDRYFSEKNNN